MWAVFSRTKLKRWGVWKVCSEEKTQLHTLKSWTNDSTRIHVPSRHAPRTDFFDSGPLSPQKHIKTCSAELLSPSSGSDCNYKNVVKYILWCHQRWHIKCRPDPVTMFLLWKTPHRASSQWFKDSILGNAGCVLNQHCALSFGEGLKPTDVPHSSDSSFALLPSSPSLIRNCWLIQLIVVNSFTLQRSGL